MTNYKTKQLLNNSLSRWSVLNGNYTFAINHPLNENSIVIELGGYDGSWVSIMKSLYNIKCYYILEPVSIFYENLIVKYNNDKDVEIIQVGMSSESKKEFIYLDNDGTSLHKKSTEFEEIELITLEYLIDKYNLNIIDLIQINIEGEEYTLLENWINSGIIKNIKRIQVQFHTWIDNAEEKRSDIQNKLIEIGFRNIYDFPFVFECWENQNI